MAGDIRQEITQVLGTCIVGTFKDMFGQEIRLLTPQGPVDYDRAKFVCTGLGLGQRRVYTNFTFGFEHHFLELATAGLFSKKSAVNIYELEDIACEITNIIGGKVRAHLNTHGYDVEMDSPFVDRDEAPPAQDTASTYLAFLYLEGASKDCTGIVVNFTVAQSGNEML